MVHPGALDHQKGMGASQSLDECGDMCSVSGAASDSQGWACPWLYVDGDDGLLMLIYDGPIPFRSPS